MKSILEEGLIYQILSVVEEIPEGYVATYGQVARLIGREKNARLVGRVLSMAEYYGDYPCHRVVNHAGRLAPGTALFAGKRRGRAKTKWLCRPQTSSMAMLKKELQR